MNRLESLEQTMKELQAVAKRSFIGANEVANAFKKSQELDAVFGYYIENIRKDGGCYSLPECSGELLDRYQIDRGSIASTLLGYLEESLGKHKHTNLT